MYKPLPDGLTIKESDVQGLGLFATKDFDSDVVLGIVHVLNKNFPLTGALWQQTHDPMERGHRAHVAASDRAGAY